MILAHIAENFQHHHASPGVVTKLKYLHDETEHTVVGRVAQLVDKLHRAGDEGVTPFDFPTGCRVSHYVLVARKKGLTIETQDETHGGAYSGHHARYHLRTKIEVREYSA